MGWRVRSRAIDETWWRDWLFWVTVALMVLTLVLNLASGGDRPWWDHAYRVGLAAFWSTVVLGSVRWFVRGFRGTGPEPEGDRSR